MRRIAVALIAAALAAVMVLPSATVSQRIDRFDVIRRTGNTYSFVRNDFTGYLTDSLTLSTDGRSYLLRNSSSNGGASSPATNVEFFIKPQAVNWTGAAPTITLPPALAYSALIRNTSSFPADIPTPYPYTRRDTVFQLSASVYALTDAEDLPYWTIFGALGPAFPDEVFVCNSTLPGTQYDFQCWSVNTTLGWSAQFLGARLSSAAGAGSGFSTVLITNSVGQAHDNEMLAIAVSIDQTYVSALADVTAILKQNSDRHSRARVAVGFIWFFGVFTLFWAIVVTGLWQSWCCPYFDCGSSTACRDCMSIPTAFGLWCLVLMAITAILSWAYGLAGMIFCALVTMFWSLVIILMYSVCARCCRNRVVTKEMMHVVHDGPKGGPPTNDVELQVVPAAAAAPPIVVPVVTPKPAVPPPTPRSKINRPARKRDAEGIYVPPPKSPVQVEGLPDSAVAASNPNVAQFLQTSPVKVDVHTPSPSNSTPTTPAADSKTKEKDADGLKPASAARPSVAARARAQSRMLLPRWNKRPFPCGVLQGNLLWSFSICLIVSFVAAILTFVIFKVDDYQLWNRQPPSQGRVVEYIPATLAKGIQSAYNFATMSKKMKMNNLFFAVSTEFCGPQYSKQLNSDSEKDKAIRDGYITPYSIDMSIYEPDNYLLYNTVNDWFSRPLKPGVRPIAGGNSSTQVNPIVVSPCDARINVFQTVPADSEIWLKDQSFTVSTLLGYDWPAFRNGGMAIIRLAPQDYHRYHAPVNGRIISITKQSGGLESVNADGMTSNNDAIYNQRTVVTFDTEYGRMAYVPIGATCVGSVEITPKPDARVVKGDEIGQFKFGGSTVVLIFEAGAVQFDEDLLFHSSRGVESLIQMGQSIGMFTTPARLL